MTSVALLGTGLLGESIGQRLLERGVSLYVWNRTRDRSQALIDAGAQALNSPSEAPRCCDSLITVLREGPVTAAVLTAIGPDFALKDQACCRNRWDVQFHCCIVLTCSDASGFKGVGNQIEIERAALQG